MSTSNFDFSCEGYYSKFCSGEKLLRSASREGLNWSCSLLGDVSQGDLASKLEQRTWITWKFEWEDLKKTSGIIGFEGLLTLSYQKWTRCYSMNDVELVRKLLLTDWTGQQIEQQIACVKNNSTVYFNISLKPIHAANLIDTFPSTELTDAILVVGDVKLHVNKTFLSMHSEHFRALFNSDFKEKSIGEIPIREVNPLAFTHLLKILHMMVDFPKDIDLEVILKLADRFIIPSVFHRVQHHLMTCSQLPFPKILEMAEQYQMEKVIDHCMALITTGSELKQVESSPFLESSIPVKLKLLDHAAKLANKRSCLTAHTAIPRKAESEENVLKYSHPEDSIEMEKLQSGSMSGLQWTWSLRYALSSNVSRNELLNSVYFSCEFEWEELRKTGVVGFDGFIDLKFPRNETFLWKLQLTESTQKIDLLVNSNVSRTFQKFGYEITLTPTTQSSDNTVMFSPSEFADAILVVEGVRMHVNRDYLSMHSEYFRTLFNSDSDEFLIEGVSPKSFERLLAVIHPICEFPEDNNFEILLTLAKRFKIPAVFNQVQHHLLTTSTLPYWKILKPADEFNMEMVVAHCAQLIDNPKDFAKIHSSPLFAKLSTPTKLKFLSKVDKFIR